MARNAAFPDGNLSRICSRMHRGSFDVRLCSKALSFSILRLSLVLACGQGNEDADTFDTLAQWMRDSGRAAHSLKPRLEAGDACARDGFSRLGGGDLCFDGLKALVFDPIQPMTLPVPCWPTPSDEGLLYPSACGFLTAVVQTHNAMPRHLLQPSGWYLKVLLIVRDLDQVAPGLLVTQGYELLQNACLLHVGKVQHPEVYCTLLSKEIEEAQALLELLQKACALRLSL